MTVNADRLCLFVSPRADADKGEIARRLREAGLTIRPWPELDATQATPPEFDMLVVLAGTAQWPASSTAALIAVLRRAWLQGATIGLFDGAAELLTAADIVPSGAPLEAEGLFIDEQLPSAGTVQEMIDAMHSAPHLER